MQSLLLEGGPTLATAFYSAGLVDKLLLFVTRVGEGDGPRFLAGSMDPLDLPRLTVTTVGEDVLVEADVHQL